MQTKMIALLFVVLLASCAMPETRIYSLDVPSAARETNPKADATITVRVNSPKYLEQPYIAFRNSPYQLTISRYAKWDSSPQEMLKETLRKSRASSGRFRDVRTSHLVTEGSYSLTVDLRRFERSDKGDASYGDLVFDVTLVSPDGKKLYQTVLTREVKLEDRSFLSLAKGLSSAVAEGVGEVTKGVEDSVK